MKPQNGAILKCSANMEIGHLLPDIADSAVWQFTLILALISLSENAGQGLDLLTVAAILVGSGSVAVMIVGVIPAHKQADMKALLFPFMSSR